MSKRHIIRDVQADIDLVPHADRTSEYNLDGLEPKPSAEEVSRIAYYRYVSQGSQPGHDVEHWLDAEAQLHAMRSNVHASLY